MITITYKAISNKQPFKQDWKTVSESLNDVKISIWGSRSKWYIEDGSVYYERIYKNNDEWETAINSFHKPSKIKARNFRFEIVKEQERQG